MAQEAMAGKRDYYEVLEVDRAARPDDVRRAYRRLARQYHPDLNPSGEAEERFKEINDRARRASAPRMVQRRPTRDAVQIAAGLDRG